MKQNLRRILAILSVICLMLCTWGAVAEEPANEAEPILNEGEGDIPDEDPDAQFDDSIQYPIDAETFPDEVFRAFVTQYDSNFDGFLSEAELYYADNMNLIETEVKNLKGLELFTNLVYLDVERTSLTSLDVSANTKLTTLYCSYSPISTLIIGDAHDALLDIECWETKLNALDVSGCPELRYLSIGFTPIKSIDLSNNFELQELNVFYCSNLKTLDISENENLLVLDASYTGLSKLDISHNPELNIVHINGTGIRSLDFTGHPNMVAALESDIIVYDDNAKVGVTQDFTYGLENRGYPGAYDQIVFPWNMRILLNGEVFYKLSPTDIWLNRGGTVSLYKGKTLQLEANYGPSEAETELTWETSDEKIATVNSKGKVTAKGAGVATITVKTDNDLEASVDINVLIKPTKVKLDKKSTVTLKKKETLQLNATLVPEEATAKMTWSSSNTKVATVSNKGKVKAKKEGTAIITVKTDNGKTAKVKIKVTK